MVNKSDFPNPSQLQIKMGHLLHTTHSKFASDDGDVSVHMLIDKQKYMPSLKYFNHKNNTR
jgi:hypothetical protein